MSKLNPMSEERKREIKNSIIKELKGMIFPGVLLAIIAGLIVFVMKYQTRPKDEEIIEVRAYSGDETPLKLENDKIKFVMDPLTTHFDVTVKSSGKVWHSTAIGGAEDSMAVAEEKSRLESDYLLTYGTEAGLDVTLDTNTYSTSNGVYEIEEGDDYIKVYYSIGKISKEFVFPLAITEANFDALMENLSNNDRSSVKGFYKLYDINKLGKKDNKEELLANYPLLETERLYILRDPDGLRDVKKKMLQNFFEQAGYTYEDFLRDKEVNQREGANTAPVFNMTVIYRLEGDDLVVEVPMGEIEGKSDYPVSKISILPYFGAGGKNDEGYMLVPEGGGSIINFNNGKSKQNVYYANVYGWDKAIERKDVVHSTHANLNVYGIAEGNDSFICIIEEGSSYAAVTADVAGRNNSFNHVCAEYTMKARERYDLGSGANTEMYVYLDNLPEDESVVQRYSFVDSGDYTDMARDYRQYLIEKYPGLITKNEDSSTPVNVEIVGAVDKKKQIFGVPVSRPVALTTYKEAANLIETIKNDGVDNLSVKYTGWFNGGVKQKVLTRVNTIHSLGSKSDLKNLTAKANELGVDLYLDGITEYAFKSTIFNGFFSYTDAAKFLSRKRAELYEYSAITYVAREGLDSYFLLHPEKIAKFANKLTTTAAKYNANASFQDIGRDLSSDFYRKNYTSREEAMNQQIAELKNAKDSGVKVMINSGNAYAVPYSDFVTNVELKGSEYTILDGAVPFYQIALHGYVNYAGIPINISGNDLEEVLYAVEYGAGLSFTFMDESSFTLQKTLYPEYYGADFSLWHEKMLEIYNEYNEKLGHTFNQEIVDHEMLTEDVTVTVYEDGTKAYVNYGYSDYSVDGITVAARDYYVVK
jgi:hypothetical protein